MPSCHARTVRWALSPEDQTWLSDRLAEFERTWSETRLSDFVADLPGTDDPRRLPALLELVQLDLALSRQHGHTPRVADYLARYPELNRPGIAGELLAREPVRAETAGPRYRATRPEVAAAAWWLCLATLPVAVLLLPFGPMAALYAGFVTLVITLATAISARGVVKAGDRQLELVRKGQRAVHWTCSPQEMQTFLDRQRRRAYREILLLPPLAAAIVLVLFAVGKGWDDMGEMNFHWVACGLLSALLGVLIGVARFYLYWVRYHFVWSRDVLLTREGATFNGHHLSWVVFNRQATWWLNWFAPLKVSAGHIEGSGPAELRLVVQSGLTRHVHRLPIPAGREAEARALLDRLLEPMPEGLSGVFQDVLENVTDDPVDRLEKRLSEAATPAGDDLFQPVVLTDEAAATDSAEAQPPIAAESRRGLAALFLRNLAGAVTQGWQLPGANADRRSTLVRFVESGQPALLACWAVYLALFLGIGMLLLAGSSSASTSSHIERLSRDRQDDAPLASRFVPSALRGEPGNDVFAVAAEQAPAAEAGRKLDDRQLLQLGHWATRAAFSRFVDPVALVVQATRTTQAQQWVTTGTLTPRERGAVSHAPGPADRLVWQPAGRPAVTFRIEKFGGTIPTGGTLLDGNHEVKYRVSIDGEMDLEVYRVRNGRRYEIHLRGTMPIQGRPHEVALVMSGSNYFENDFSGFEQRDDHTISGTIRTGGMELTVAETVHFQSVGAGGDIVSFDWRKINNRLVLDGTTYQWDNVFLKKNFRNGRVSGADTYDWTCQGRVLKAGQAFATYAKDARGFLQANTGYIQYQIHGPGGVIEVERWRLPNQSPEIPL